MKLSFIAHTFTFLSFVAAILGAIFISPIVLTSLICTYLIFKSAEHIRLHERRLEKYGH